LLAGVRIQRSSGSLTVQREFRLNGEVRVRLFVTKSVRRCVGLAFLLFFTVPFGLSVIGCGHKAAPPVYCNSGNSGPVVGQTTQIVLSQNLSITGESLNYGQIGPQLSAVAYDCQHNNVSVTKFTYATTNMTIADVNPATGSACGGSWNRQSGSGIPDYTICTAPAAAPSTSVAYITASADGVASNAIAVFVHPVVTGVQLTAAQSSLSAGCTVDPSGVLVDPTSDCCPNYTTGGGAPAPGYDSTSCVSQNTRVQLAAKVYYGGFTDAAHNITCQVGNLTFATQGAASVVTIDQYGFATADQPGSTLITASVANSTSASNAGFFSTCPPASITLSATGPQAGQDPINVAINNALPLTATVLDTNGKQITGLPLEFNSTTPQTISASSGAVVPTFPGSATITAVCQPGSCNPSPLSQTGYLGNGKPITSNGITVNAAGTSGTVLYMASTDSQYVVPYDFTLNQQGGPIKLPFVPNSMVISQDGSTLYFGSPQGLMTITTSANSASGANQNIPGVVLAVSPDGTTAVIADPTRQTVSLVSSGAITTSYGNVVATSAAWSPDSITVYITTNTPDVLLTHSAFNNWQVTDTNHVAYTDVTVMVPHVGAYFAGVNQTDGRSYCPTTTIQTPGSNGNPPVTANVYYPLADVDSAPTQVVAATTDGKHILGADVPSSGPATLSDIILPSLPPQALDCTTANGAITFSSTPATFPLSSITVVPQTNPAFPANTPGIIPQGITGVVPASNSALAFVTYNGSSGLLPEYVPSTATVNYLQLGNGATTSTAPLAGVFSTDNLNFYAGASDGQVHMFSINGTAATETGVLQPNLTPASGSGAAPVNLLAQRPKRTQS
jgi:hypothetical protein